MLIEDLPERLALPKLLRTPAAQRNDPTSQVNRVLGRLHARRGKIRFEGMRIAVNEVENAVMELGAKKHKLKDQDAVRILEIARKIADSSKK